MAHAADALRLVPAVTAAAAAAPADGSAVTGTVSGVVLDAEGAPVADADVLLLELRRRVAAGADGAFRFAGIPPGQYLLQITSAREGASVVAVTVSAGPEVRLEVRLDPQVHHEQVVVTAAGEARGLAEVAQPVAVLGGDELAGHLQMTLGETLAGQPGVSSTYFGPGASRPILRGLGGDRIRVLEGGIGSGDASASSPDHAVATNPLSAESIEILRGPATLLYGSSAIGGAVNVLDSRIPDAVPGVPLTGRVELRGGSVADERSGAALVEGGLGERFAWHVDAFRRETDDYEIPGFAEHAHADDEPGHEDEEEAFGTLPNSAVEAEGATAGVSFVGGRGFLGASFSAYDSLYGVPGHAHSEAEDHSDHAHDEAEEEESPVRIDLTQRRADLRGELRFAGGFLEGLQLRAGRSDYEHQELEGDAVGTRFTNESWEARLEAPHRPLGRIDGSIGLQAGRRDFEAIGEEAFVPPTVTDSRALFAFEELTAGALRWQLGLRWEEQDIDAEASAAAAAGRRSHSGVSGSAGLVWLREEAWSVGVSLARSTKLPNAEELFSNGPHIATRAFEIGEPGLGVERSLGLDLTGRKLGGRVHGELTVFANRIDDFIFERATGEVLDGLQVLQFTQEDAEFQGAELHVDVELLHDEPHHLDLELIADVVRAELSSSGEPLPRIPPVRYGAGLRYGVDRWWLHGEVRRIEEQDRVAALEEPTAGYTLINADAGYRFFLGDTVHDLVLRGTNLGDEEARQHTSFLKEVAPLPGRDVTLSYRLGF